MNRRNVIAAAALLIFAAWIFRYETTRLANANGVARLDRWTGEVELCGRRGCLPPITAPADNMAAQ